MTSKFETAYKSSIILIAAVLLLASVGIIFESANAVIEGNTPEQFEERLSKLEPIEEQDLNADTLRKICESSARADEGLCFGYLVGFLEGRQIGSSLAICAPVSITTADQIEKKIPELLGGAP